MKDVRVYMQKADGTRAREIDWSDGVSVKVESTGGTDAEVEAVATVLASVEEAVAGAETAVKGALAKAAQYERDWYAAKSEFGTSMAKARARIRELEAAALPPARPTRVLGTGYVRFADGKVWLLNNRERGFGEFGFEFASWDAMFRAFDVQITGHGVDEHGPWWSAENMPKSAPP